MFGSSIVLLPWLACIFVSSVSSAPTGTAPLPPNSSGSLRGSEEFLGNDGNPISSADSAIVSNAPTVPGQNEAADLGLYLDFTNVQDPQPIRGTNGGTDPSRFNTEYDRINSDLFSSPGTDAGGVPNAKWPMGLSHNRLGINGGGWARQQNVAVLPIATAMAGVDMRLSPNAYRELHWHSAGEWSLVLKGSVRVSATNDLGEFFIDDLQEGDVWFFPPGVPHSLQALDEGVEFLLVFDDGSFSEDDTFLASELFLRNPRSVLAKNFRTDVSSFDNLPTDQLYIFPGTPAPTNISAQNMTGPGGYIAAANAYTYHFSQQQPLVVPGGSVKILDPQTFPIASMFSAALVTLEPGAMRELHWHLTSDEWSFFIQGSARVTVFEGPSSSGTFDFQDGDVGYIPVAQSHYIENTGSEPVIYLEVLQAPRFSDISVATWLGLTPRQVVKDTLHLPDAVLDNLPKVEQFIVPGDTNMTQTNFTTSA